MRQRTMLLLLALALCLYSSGSPAQQGQPDTRDRELTAAQRTAIIEGALQKLNDAYVFPDVAKKMEGAVRARMARNEYNSVTSSRALAAALTDHLREVSRDKHIRVRFSYDPLPTGQATNPDLARQQAEFGNYGFQRVERLPGNVGYLDFRGFADGPAAQEVAASAMNFLAGTNALIVDLRQNGGGSPFMVAFISSYLFGPEPVHLNDLYWRVGNRTDSFHTRRDVPGRRFGPDKPVYVLTANYTFSAAEEFTYNLKNLKRAIIVGETTGGGAHPGGPQRINEHFAIQVPSGRAINPISKTNWEGTGVTPDIAVSADLALLTAHRDALQKIAASSQPEPIARGVRDALATVERDLAARKSQ